MSAPAPEFFPAGPTAILDGTLDRVKAATGFKGWKQRALPTKDDDVPFVLVWHGGDRTEPMGDANVGAPSFDHTLKIIVVVAVSASKPDGLDLNITVVTEQVRVALLTDPTWLELIEACTKADIGYAFPGDGEIPYARGLIEIEVTYRSEWWPAGDADLDEVDIDVRGTPIPTQVVDFRGTR